MLRSRLPEERLVLKGSEGGLPIDRVTVSDDEIGGFRVSIPARRNVPMILFLGLWLCGWAVGEVVVPAGAIAAMASGHGKMAGGQGPLVLLVWFPFWTVAGLMVMFALWWNFAGREVVIFSDGVMVVKREVGAVQRSRSYDLAGVRNLRYSPLVYNPFSISGSWHYQFQMLGFGGGSVAFDHGSDTHRFGNSLTEREAARLIATIRQQYKIPEDRVVTPLPVSK